MKIDIYKSVEIESTIRTELLSSMFEVPASTKLSVSLTGESLHDQRAYNIGLIVGPSGSGKTLLLETLFGVPEKLEWNSRSVIDDFPKELSMEDISRVCQSVGFNTVPSWLRPYSVLSNGERFRVEVSRYLLQSKETISMDEFTSVVDRQVAQFACHSIQKYIREKKKRLVVASCHYDIIPWLQPDWVLEPGNPCRFTWRSLRGRPPINAAVSRVQYSTWRLFAPFHYMSAELNRAARCYGLYVKTSPELSTGMDLQIYDDGVRALSNGCNDSVGSSSDLRIPSGLSMHRRTGDSRMVLHEDDRIESEFSRTEPGSSDSSEFLGSGDSRNTEKSRRSSNENESGDKLSGEKVTGIIGQEENSAENDVSNSLSRPSSESLPGSESSSKRCDGLRVQRLAQSTYRITSMCGVLYRPHPRVSDIYGFTRMVTLPDFQGLGLAFVLACKVASAYKALGKRLHSYPNHPAWIRSYQRSPLWLQVKQSGTFSPKRGISSTVDGFGGRRCAVFLYIGDAMNKEEAERLVNAE